MNDATNASLRPCDELGRRSELAQLPVDDHADLVGERRRVLVVVRHEHRRQIEARAAARCSSPRTCDFVCASSAESGSSSSSTAGSRASARASATRCRSPPESVAGRTSASCGDAEALEQLVDALAPAVGDVRADGQVREERVLLEHEPDAALLRPQVDAALDVEPRLVVERDAARGRVREAGDRPQHRRLARARRPDERDGPRDVERERQLEVAKRKREVESEGSHLRVTRRAALMRTSNALTASATSKSTSNSA